MLKPALLAFIAFSLTGCVLQLPAQSQPAPQAAPQQPPSQPQASQPQPDNQLKFGDSVPGGWVHISTVGKNAYQIQERSFRFDKTTDGVSLAVVIARTVDLSTQGINIYQWSVPIEDCISGRGTLVIHDTKGNLFTQNDFVFGGGNVASLVAETICEVAVKAADEQQRSQPTKRTQKPRGQEI
ncbi:hypothetical protein D3C77_42020 [compost metagenome]